MVELVFADLVRLLQSTIASSMLGREEKWLLSSFQIRRRYVSRASDVLSAKAVGGTRVWELT